MPSQIKMPFTVSANTKIGVISRNNVRSIIQPTTNIQQTNINMMPIRQTKVKTISLPKSTSGCGCGK